MIESSLQQAQRWMRFWASAMDSYAHMCTEACLDNNLESARRFARRYDASQKRFWNAFAREMVAKHGETPSRVNWFGEVHE